MFSRARKNLRQPPMSEVISSDVVEKIRARFLVTPKSRFGVRGYPPEFVAAIHADYVAHGEVVAQIAARWNRKSGSIAALLQKWGFRQKCAALTEQIKKRQRDKGGRVAANRRATAVQIEAIIASATKLAIPPQLRWEFRTWPMSKKADFIARLRAKLRDPDDRPKRPFSRNVVPFDYTTPAARAILDRLNEELDSRHAICKLDLGTQGVIWNGDLWFWVANTGYVQRGQWTPERGRPILSRALWEQYHGRIPPKHVIRCADGNPNNLDPGNLVLATMNDLARENQAAALTRKAREKTALVLERAQQKGKRHDLFEALSAAA